MNTKRIITIIVFIISYSIVFGQQKRQNTISGKGEVCVFISDPDTKYATNIRNAPGGKIVYKVPIENREYYSFKIVEVKKGWCKIQGNLESALPDEGVKDIELKGNCWVHYSVLGMTVMGSREDLTLKKEPKDNSKPIVCVCMTGEFVRVVDLHNEWVKVEWINAKKQRFRGWMRSDWTCCNPLTICN